MRQGFTGCVGKYGAPGICNSDQGSQFTSADSTKVLLDAGGKIFMDGRGGWIDNRMVERLWRSLKCVCVYLNAFETGSEARKGISDWIGYYNQRRPHSAHDLLKPAEVYDKQNSSLKATAWSKPTPELNQAA